MRRTIVLVFLAAQAVAAQDVFIEVQKSQASDLRERDAFFLGGRILDRAAAPLDTDPQREFRRLQERHLDLRDPKQRAFLEQAQQTDDPRVVFAIDVTTTVDDSGRHIAGGSAGSFRESARVGTRRKAGRIRDPLSGVVRGVIYGSAWPPTMFGLVQNPERTRRTDVALDHSYGKYGNGTPYLSAIEYTTESLIAQLYLSVPWTSDTIIRTGRFEPSVSVASVEAAGPQTKVRRLTAPVTVSILASVRDGAIRVAYNPQDLHPDEALAIVGAIRRDTRADAIVVGPENTVKGADILVLDAGSRWAVLNHEYWKRLVSEGVGLLAGQRPAVAVLPASRDSLEILEEASTVELPAATEVVEDTRGGVGVYVRRPTRLPMAHFLGGDVSWLSADETYVNRVMSVMAAAVGAEPLQIINNLDGLRNVRQPQRRPRLPAPIVVLDGNGFVEVRIGRHWTNPFTETNKRKALGFLYDPQTATYGYLTEGVPPTRPTTGRRPNITGKPRVEEVAGR